MILPSHDQSRSLVLTLHSLNADDLAQLLGTQKKDLRKFCGRLREDRMISVYAFPRDSRQPDTELT